MNKQLKATVLRFIESYYKFVLGPTCRSYKHHTHNRTMLNLCFIVRKYLNNSSKKNKTTDEVIAVLIDEIVDNFLIKIKSYKTESRVYFESIILNASEIKKWTRSIRFSESDISFFDSDLCIIESFKYLDEEF